MNFICLPFEASLQTPDRFSVICFTYHVVQILINGMSIIILFTTHTCMQLLYLLSELSCEYFHSTHLACWFGQMLTKAILWMKSSIASPTLRGVPVSLVRPWIWSLFYIRFRYQINSSSLTSTLDEMTDLESCISLPAVFLHHRPILESVVCLHTTV